ncbi:MAG: hypothetical protein RMJ15_07800 [Nitrososphaerota archaeon]|nr:hypothetical protein [Candidatus Bathyarchaeota archaeon]MDW8023621.1 hypothetical protein [Nitrososphaerota archaeon]
MDHLIFEDCRFSAVVGDSISQSLYGLRELTETDDELYSDNACLRRANALLDHLKNPAEYIVLKSTVLDYGGTPPLPGDKIYVFLPNEAVSGYFRIEAVEYVVDAKTQTLEVTLELGKAPPLLADYLYGLRSTTVTVEKLARTKVGKGYLPLAARKPTSHTHAAGEITSGQFPLARLPRGPQGYVLEAQGVDYDPMYVNPNYRYQPAPHTHAGQTITPYQVSCNYLSAAVIITSNAFGDLFPLNSDTGAVGTTAKYWNCIAGNSVWYKALGQFDALDDLALIKRIRGNGKTDEKGVPLADPESLPPEITENGLINAGHLTGLLIGAVKQLVAKVEQLEKRLGGV